MSVKQSLALNEKYKRVIVIGTSAGGLNALLTLVKQLPADFPAPILVVQHISPDITGEAILDALNKCSRLKCKHGQNDEVIKAGNIYLAPPNHHMMVGSTGRLLLTKGATENRSRPGIDPLFRSAAIHFRNKLIGIILTGYLDDGTAGMIAVKRCGGTCIIQNPEDAAYPDMPQNASNQVDVDHCVNLAEMGGLLAGLLNAKLNKNKPVPPDIIREAAIAERVLSDLPSVNALGEQVPFNCPGCGGVLWKIDEGPLLRYRCHTGHAYTAKVLLEEQTLKIEETMWTALRMFEERRNLLITLSKEKQGHASTMAKERAEISQVHIDRIRAILLSDEEA